METSGTDLDLSFGAEPPNPAPNRLLNPVELITLARMAFPNCEPCVDADGRFVIRGLERREAVEKRRGGKEGDMFPFALTSGRLFIGFASAPSLLIGDDGRRSQIK